jgi:site-specific recombinase XerD
MSVETDPITPAEAKKMYLDAREHEVAQSTVEGYHYRLKHFVRWCEDVKDINNLNELTGRDLQRFKTWRRDDGDLKPVTMESNLDTLRLFLRWCESINAVEPNLHEKVEALMPTLDKSDEQADSILDTDEAEALIEYQRKYDYASRPHVIVEILWHTGIRLGALQALDVDDYNGEAERLRVRHRPDTETPLKNDNEGERVIALDPEVCRVIEDWIDQYRHDVTDEYGRKPLLTTRNGRIDSSTVRHTVYQVTRPCYYSNECPVGREPDECEATEYNMRL